MKLLYSFFIGAVCAGIVGYMFWYDATHLSEQEIIDIQHAGKDK